VIFGPWSRAGRRKKLLAQPVVAEVRETIARNVAVFARLSPAEQASLLDAARIIAHERRFVGCKGLVVTDEIKLTIAAQAALLLLGEEGYYFDRVTSFLVYPYKMILPPAHRRHSHDDGDHDHGAADRVILGQAFQGGEIILSWPDALHGGQVADDGENVVLHELAHHLDGLDGHMGGSPPGLSADDQERFHEVVEASLAQLGRELDDGTEQGDAFLLPPAAEESPAELFAYSTEAFFERPHDLARRFPDLFAVLRSFYKVDTTRWFTGSATSSTAWHAALPPARRPLADDDLPESPENLPQLPTADDYFTRGCEYFDLGRFDLAAADFHRAVRMKPTDQEAVLWRGRTNYFNGHVEAALADAERACKLLPSDLEAVALRGMCRAALGDFPGALRDFDLSTSDKTDDVHLLFARGVARRELGQLAAAIDDFGKVLRADPEDAEAYFERAQCYDQLGKQAEAERDLAAARRLGLRDADEGPREIT
jgi:Mlc titration factor MtfA (ptsG expression regulator)/Flp pilus assembly protein TadD